MSRPHLIFARVGPKSLHRRWLEGPETRNWDLQLSSYVDDPTVGDGGDFPLSIDTGTKWDSIYRFLVANPDLLERYRYIMFPDDDLLISKAALNRMFAIYEEFDLLVAQPALDPASYYCHPIVLQCPLTKLRYTNFVECMAASIRADHLRSFIPHMAQSKTGWGMDLVWALTMPAPQYRSAIVDEVTVLHTRRHMTGEIYKTHAKGGVTPQEEMLGIINSFVGVPRSHIAYAAILPNGQRIGGALTRLLNGAYLGATAMQFRNPPRVLQAGAAMLMRAVTLADYLPSQIHKAHG